MQIGIVSLFPEAVRQAAEMGVVGRALMSGQARLELANPRDHAPGRHRSVDDRPYGGGPGMVMQVAPLRAAIGALKATMPTGVPVLLMSPQGRRFDQARARALADRDGMILVCGRYEGVDERLVELEIDEELSIGDYVLSGGELPALVVMDAVTRLLPGVLGDELSAAQDSFVAGLLDCPHYTRPEVCDGLVVPDVLLGGDHQAVSRWRLKQALGRTWLRRPELLERRRLSAEEEALLAEFKAEAESEATN